MTVKIVNKPIVHIVRDAELFEFVQHREMTNCVEGFTKIEGNDNDVQVVGKHGGYCVEEVDDGGRSGTSRSEGELVIKCEIRWRTVEGGIDERSHDSSFHHAGKYWSDTYRPKVCNCLWCIDFGNRSNNGLFPLVWHSGCCHGHVEQVCQRIIYMWKNNDDNDGEVRAIVIKPSVALD